MQFIGLQAAEIIAHRGASHDAPENTLASMKLAWEQKADAIELDLWLSKDGRLVVMHDGDTKRVGGPERKLTEQTWDELKQLDVGSWKHASFKGERIPTLESILATIPSGRRAFLEIKCGPEILDELERVLQQAHRPPEQLVVISFSLKVLERSKKRFPQFDHYLLHDYKKDSKTERYPELAPLLENAKEAGLDGLGLQFKWPMNEAFVKELNSAGLKLFVWTVNDPEVARKMFALGVDAIGTDRPGWLREQLK